MNGVMTWGWMIEAIRHIMSREDMVSYPFNFKK
jgi:hypothetical protein